MVENFDLNSNNNLNFELEGDNNKLDSRKKFNNKNKASNSNRKKEKSTNNINILEENSDFMNKPKMENNDLILLKKNILLDDCIQDDEYKNDLISKKKIPLGFEKIIDSSLEKGLGFDNKISTYSKNQNINNVSGRNLNMNLRSKNNKIFKVDEILGSYDKEDSPLRIIDFYISKDNLIYLRVEWQKRNDGTTPLPCLYSSKVLKEKNPELLIDFYENKFLEKFKKKLI